MKPLLLLPVLALLASCANPVSFHLKPDGRFILRGQVDEITITSDKT